MKEYQRPQYSLPPSCESEKYPWLMFSHGKDKQRQTFFNILEDRYYTKIIPELRNKQVVCCCHGWLVLKDLDSDDYFLLNLLLLEEIQLPRLEGWEYKYYFLWLPPSDPKCHLLLVTDDFLLSWQPGDNKFFRRNFYFPIAFTGWTYESSIIVHQKKIYAILEPHSNIFVADFEESKIIRFTKLINNGGPIPLKHGMTTYRRYLIEYGDELLLVDKIFSLRFDRYDMALDFEIYRLDQAKGTWLKLKNIGKLTIFLSKDEGKCCLVTDARIKRNSIYFTRERNLHVFDLDDRSITVSLPCSNVSRDDMYVSWIW